MKTSKLISCLLAIAFVLSSMQIIAFAQNEDTHDCEITFEFCGYVSENAKNKIIAHFSGEETTSKEARGVACNLFGHKIETSTVNITTHKEKATAPRCLKETYRCDTCSRCDYSNYTLLGGEYIYCCS